MVCIRFGRVFRACGRKFSQFDLETGWRRSWNSLGSMFLSFPLVVFTFFSFPFCILMETCNLLSCLIIVIRYWVPSALLVSFSFPSPALLPACYDLV